MNADILLNIQVARWTFLPRTFKARRWVERNFDRYDLSVNPRRGPNIVRALDAEGLKVETPDGAIVTSEALNAHRNLIPAEPCQAILLVGIGGTGKTSIARHLQLSLATAGISVRVIHFDQFRRDLVPPGQDPFTREVSVKRAIYGLAAARFKEMIGAGEFLVIDSGLSVESIRREMRSSIPQLRLIHVHCPLWLACARDTRRSLRGARHHRGRFLHLRALLDLLNPFKRDKFPQPGVTYEFEYPSCADMRVSTADRSPEETARLIAEGLGLIRSRRFGEPLGSRIDVNG